MSTSPWDSLARQQRPVRPSLQALHVACSPPTLADTLDELEESLVAFSVDLNNLAVTLAPILNPDEDGRVSMIGLVHSAEEIAPPDRGDTAPAVGRVEDVRRQVRAMHDQLFDIASRIAL